MKEIPVISIIIPLYNAEKFVLQAYNSVCSQKLNLPLEIIFVDNNSKDSSYTIAMEIASKDSRVKVFMETLQGAASARNKGFDESTGDFVYFFDVDDQLFDHTLKTLSNVLLNNTSIDAVFGKMLKSHVPIWEMNTANLEESEEIHYFPKPYWGLKWFSDLSSVVGPPAFMYRRNAFLKIGKYDTRLQSGEDTALDIALGMTSEIAFVDKYVYVYYKHGSSLSDGQKISLSRSFLQWPRLIYSHLPFHLNNPEEKEYGEILRQKIYLSVPKMIVETKDTINRQNLKKKLLSEIKPLKIPLPLRMLLSSMVVFPSSILLKIYLYKFMKLYK